MFGKFMILHKHVYNEIFNKCQHRDARSKETIISGEHWAYSQGAEKRT